ncbi:MAG: LytR C-terminal domain-containing protein [Elusimicrobiota bacterium]
MKVDFKGWVLAGILLSGVAALAVSDLRSDLAEGLRSGEPLTLLVSMRFQGQGNTVPPALYALFYGPKHGTLEVVTIPSSAREGAQSSSGTVADIYGRAYARGADPESASRLAAQAAALSLGGAVKILELGAGSAEESFPERVREGLSGAAGDPLFWFRARRLKAAFTLASRGGLSPYDAFLLAWAMARLRPSVVALSRMPAPELVPRFLEGLRARAQGQEAVLGERVSVEIFNASGAAGLAMRARKVLISSGDPGFDVVHWGDARAAEGSVRFIDREGRPAAAEAVRQALGCPPAPPQTEMESDPRAAVTVILGGGYRACSRLVDAAIF